MKIILVILLSTFNFFVFGQKNLTAESIKGKNIYCVKSLQKYNDGGKQSSFTDLTSSKFLFKISFTSNNNYTFTDKYQSTFINGTFHVKGNIISLKSNGGIATNYIVSQFFGDYLTLKTGDTTFYCFVD